MQIVNLMTNADPLDKCCVKPKKTRVGLHFKTKTALFSAKANKLKLYITHCFTYIYNDFSFNFFIFYPQALSFTLSYYLNKFIYYSRAWDYQKVHYSACEFTKKCTIRPFLPPESALLQKMWNLLWVQA